MATLREALNDETIKAEAITAPPSPICSLAVHVDEDGKAVPEVEACTELHPVSWTPR